MFDINEILYNRKRARPGEEGDDLKYGEILSFVKAYINEHHREDLTGDITKDIVKDRYKVLIHGIVTKHGFFLPPYSEAQLIELLYNSMAKYDFLTPYLESSSGSLPDNELYSTWEEINCNRFDDVEVVVEGKYIKLEKAFETPEQCVDIVRRMARLGGLTLDKANPRGDSFLGKGIRITATLPPCVDSDTGAVFSIRRQKDITNDMDFFVKNGTATEEMLKFLILLINYGVSMGFAGGTGSGKTTDINFILRNVDAENRIYTIEDSRELNLVRKGSDGKYLSRVIHTVTRESADEKYAVTADDLLRDALRYHPKIIGLGEMRGAEAKPFVTIGGTDHTVLNGIHAGGQRSGYRRISTLYMDSGTNLSENMVYQNIVEAIPIMVHKKAFRSGERRYMSISEAVLSDDLLNPQITFNVIYRFVVKDFVRDQEGRLLQVLGEHKKVGNISKKLAQRLFENGVELSVLREYAGEDFVPSEGGEEV